MKILVPHDGSAFSDKALEKAIIFAHKLKCEIILLNVLDLKILQSDFILKFLREKLALKAKTEFIRYLKNSNESMLKQKLQEFKTDRVRINLRLEIGSTSEVIVKVARLQKVEFIIMGSRGLSSESKSNKMRMGSIAARVSELAECPVMIVK